MRLQALLVVAILCPLPAAAQTPTPAPPTTPAATPTPSPSPTPSPLDLPVSLDKIRSALARPAPIGFRRLDVQPMFRIEVEEREKLDELLKTLNFNSGPAIPGGLYGYEQQRQIFPPSSYPGMQPYAAFTPGELLQVSLTSIVEAYLAKKIVSGIGGAIKKSQEEAAKDDVRRAIADYCGAQPRGGAGIDLCDHPPLIK